MATTYVKLPFEDLTNLPYDLNWATIHSALSELKAKCVMFSTQGLIQAQLKYGDARYWVRNAICTYNYHARTNCNFQVIETNAEILCPLLHQLPLIIENALSLPERLAEEDPNPRIPILQQEEGGGLQLKRKQIGSLLANAFLSTFPKQSESTNLPSFNFWRLFHKETDSDKKYKNGAKLEKLKCMLEYFRHIRNGDALPNSVISFERLINEHPVVWENSKVKLGNLTTTCTGRIEDAKGMLQVDFANKSVGGGVLSDGVVQEEIRFCISPELMVARLFTERLGHDEVLLITGTRQFSSYTGYGASSFKFKKLDAPPTGTLPVDGYGREPTQIVAMDAINFQPKEVCTQYLKDRIDRELHKSYTAFGSGNQTSIATGNWGCGAFNGDPQLKFIIQWMAASQNNRSVLYHARHASQENEFEKIKQFLVAKQVTVGQLYSKLLALEKEALNFVFLKGWNQKLSVFEFLTNSQWS